MDTGVYIGNQDVNRMRVARRIDNWTPCADLPWPLGGNEPHSAEDFVLVKNILTTVHRKEDHIVKIGWIGSIAVTQNPGLIEL